MTKQAPVIGFSPGERDYVHRELDMFFSTLPTVAEGFQLKTWCGGPEAGKPKVSPVARSLAPMQQPNLPGRVGASTARLFADEAVDVAWRLKVNVCAQTLRNGDEHIAANLEDCDISAASGREDPDVCENLSLNPEYF